MSIWSPQSIKIDKIKISLKKFVTKFDKSKITNECRTQLKNQQLYFNFKL